MMAGTKLLRQGPNNADGPRLEIGLGGRAGDDWTEDLTGTVRVDAGEGLNPRGAH